jgi:hypothetical protein
MTNTSAIGPRVAPRLWFPFMNRASWPTRDCCRQPDFNGRIIYYNVSGLPERSLYYNVSGLLGLGAGQGSQLALRVPQLSPLALSDPWL